MTDISKKAALRLLKDANYVTMDSYEVANSLGILHPVGSPIVGVPRRVTDTRSDGVALDGSWVHIGKMCTVALDEDRRLVVSGIDNDGAVWVRMTYSITKLDE